MNSRLHYSFSSVPSVRSDSHKTPAISPNLLICNPLPIISRIILKPSQAFSNRAGSTPISCAVGLALGTLTLTPPLPGVIDLSGSYLFLSPRDTHIFVFVNIQRPQPRELPGASVWLLDEPGFPKWRRFVHRKRCFRIFFRYGGSLF